MGGKGKVSPRMSLLCEAAATMGRKGPPAMAGQCFSLLEWASRPMHRGGCCFASAAGLLGPVDSMQGHSLGTEKFCRKPHPVLVLWTLPEPSIRGKPAISGALERQFADIKPQHERAVWRAGAEQGDNGQYLTLRHLMWGSGSVYFPLKHICLLVFDISFSY